MVEEASSVVIGTDLETVQHVCIVVLGPIGRSPRMQYHAASLARRGVKVTLLGYGEGPLIDGGQGLINEVRSSHIITTLPFTDPFWGKRNGIGFWKTIRRRVYPLFALAKLVTVGLKLLWGLLILAESFDAILVQTPPAMPTLMVVWLACRLRGARMIIDWHNLGYSMLPYMEDNIIAKLAKAYEGILGRRANASLCVSEAMSKYLAKVFNIKAQVLYDRPPHMFQPSNKSPKDGGDGDGTALLATHQMWSCNLANDMQSVYDRHWRLIERNEGDSDVRNKSFIEEDMTGCNNPFTFATKSTSMSSKKGEEVNVTWQPDRPALVVSSTSWTPDEDFTILLNALKPIDDKLKQAADLNSGKKNSLPLHLVVIITGKGPMRKAFLEAVDALDLERISVAAVWLTAEDYPRLLSCCDIGVSLHISTSGIDLPMKVLDMFGSGLPVLSVRYDCIGELIRDGENGRLFSDATELASLLLRLLDGTREAKNELCRLQYGAMNIERWEETWEKAGWPTICSRSRPTTSFDLFWWWFIIVVVPFIGVLMLAMGCLQVLSSIPSQ
eukprot:6362_1